MAANRNIVCDILSGIFILRMVYTHSCMYAEQSSHTFLFNLTGMFLMWFFFKGGLLAKEGCNVLDAITPLSKKLLKPFIFLTFVAVLMDSALYLIDIANTFGNTKYEYESCKCNGIESGLRRGGYYANNEIVRTVGSIVVNGSAHGNMPIWFLFSYFFVRIGFAFQQTYLRQVSLIWFAIFCLIIPFVLHFCTFRYPYYFSNVALGLFGYYAGYVYNLNADKRENFIAVISALLYVGIFVFCKSLVDIRTNTLYEGFYLLWALWSISGCIFFYILFKKVKFLREIFCRLGIASIGQMSMSILILHWPLLIVADFIRYYCLDIPKNCYLIYYLLVIVIFTVPLHFYLKKSKLKFLIGL